MRGWIKLHRELLDKAIWKDGTNEQRAILIALLLMANYRENEWEWKGQRFEAMPGQFVTSLEKIAEKAGKGVSIQNVRSALKRFEKKYQFLTNESTKSGRLITIVNWEEYQGDDDYDNSRNNSQVTANKNGKNNNISSPSGKAQSARVPQCQKNLIDGEPSPAGEHAAVGMPHPIWGDGVDLLTSSGMKESSARAFLGRALKTYGEGAVHDAISTCILEQPVNPSAYLMGCLKKAPRLGTGHNKQASGPVVSGRDIIPGHLREGRSGKL